jgi:hypothetical protein
MSTATSPNANGVRNENIPADPWMMTVGGGGGGGDYVACPPGNFPGTLVGIFDIGHQEEKDMNTGGTVEKRKIVLAYELSKKKPDGSPFVLAQRQTWSMHEKANFYKLVTNITGAKFKEGEKFNPLSLLGLPVMVNVTNTTSGDKTYHDIGNISQFPEGFSVPTPTHKPISWSVLIGIPFPDDLTWVPFIYGKSIKELAEASSEVKKRGSGNGGGSPAPAASSSGVDDSIPF